MSQNSIRRRLGAIPDAYQGAFWKVMACLFFAALNGVVRHLSHHSGGHSPLSSYEIAFFQNVFGLFVMMPFMGRRPLRVMLSLGPKGAWQHHVVRIVGAVLGVVLWYLSLRYMSIAEAVALGFTGPVFTVLGARFYLKEQIGLIRWGGILCSLAGAFMITRPDLAFYGHHPIGLYALFPLLSAVAIAVSKLMTRDLACMGHDPKALAGQLLFWMMPVSFFLAIWTFRMPVGSEWFWLISLGFLSAAAHYTTSLAYQKAEVSFLMPFGFARFFFSMMVGLVAFAEWPTGSGFWMGLSVILTSAFLLSFEKKTTQKAT